MHLPLICKSIQFVGERGFRAQIIYDVKELVGQLQRAVLSAIIKKPIGIVRGMYYCGGI